MRSAAQGVGLEISAKLLKELKGSREGDSTVSFYKRSSDPPQPF